MTARILVVDDIPSNLRLLEAQLAAEYYAVTTASDGKQALALARDLGPDLILLDVMMPGMDGYEVCRRLKSDPATEHIPVVMVTALREVEERVRGLEAGADDFLTKPVEDKTLIVRTRSLIRQKRMLDEARVREQTAQDLGVVRPRGDLRAVSGARALVVDDYDFDAEKVVAALSQEGIECQRARSAEEMMKLLGSRRFDLVVISLSLGNADPLRLSSQLKAVEETRSLPLLLVADSEHKDQLLRGLDLGVNDYVMRPIEASEIRARARNQILRKFYQERLRENLEYSISLATVDELSGLYNQRYLRSHLKSLLTGRDAAARQPVAVMVMDIDRFKQINDRFGHAAGDEAIREVGACLRSRLRAFDTVARYGGDEFVVVMPGASEPEAEKVGERVRAAISNIVLRFAEGQEHRITTSIGIAVHDPERGGPWPADLDEALVRAADQALYRAKEQGRNRVVVSDAAL